MNLVQQLATSRGRRLICTVLSLLWTLAYMATSQAEAAAADSENCSVTQDRGKYPSVLVLTLVLPDGLGDVIFGECAVLELKAAPANITWLRVYPSEESRDAGELLVAEASAAATSESRAFASYDSFGAEVDAKGIDGLWIEAQQVFLAPWIFGIARDESLLSMVNRVGRHFWATTEYGRGMGHIFTYTGGLGHRIPSGWPPAGVTGSEHRSGVFKTILKAGRGTTDWRAHFAGRVGLDNAKARLWWAYGRKDSASVHEFKLLTAAEPSKPVPGAAGRWPRVSKIIPIAEDGSLATGEIKTTGELLKEQVDKVLESPQESSPQATVAVSAQSETAAHVAGQLSQLLVHILTQDAPQEGQAAAEIVIAPNADVRTWSGEDVVHIAALELLSPSGEKTLVTPGRPVFLVADSVPRKEMRGFLEQCEHAVIATGDQSVAEAVLLGKVPMAKPDAKAAQWELAIAALSSGIVDDVPDLGQVLRSLLESSEARTDAMAWSQAQSAAVEAKLTAQFGPGARGATPELLARAGMFG